MLSKRTVVKIVSFLCAAVFSAMGFAFKERAEKHRYLTMIENQYTSSFEQLDSSLNNITDSLEKVIYVSSAKKMSALSAEFSANRNSQKPLFRVCLPQRVIFLQFIGFYRRWATMRLRFQKI